MDFRSARGVVGVAQTRTKANHRTADDNIKEDCMQVDAIISVRRHALHAFGRSRVTALAHLIRRIEGIGRREDRSINGDRHVVRGFLMVGHFDFMMIGRLRIIVFRRFFRFFDRNFFIRGITGARATAYCFVFVDEPSAAANNTSHFHTAHFLAHIVRHGIVVGSRQAYFERRRALAGKSTAIFRFFRLFRRHNQERRGAIASSTNCVLTRGA